MAVFEYVPDFSARQKSKPNISRIKFGDGYEQRVANGLNSNPKTWTLTFANREIDEIDEIEDFLEARNAVEAFDWTPPREDTAVRVVCTSWDRSYDNPQTDTITATFEQVYEP